MSSGKGTFRQVHTNFWNDTKIVEDYSPDEKYFYLYLLTNRFTKQIGIYQITKKQIAFDIGYSVEAVTHLLNKFINDFKVIEYNEETSEIAVLNWGKYNLDRGGKPFMDCIISELKNVKDHKLIEALVLNIKNEPVKSEFLRYSSEAVTNRGQEEEKEKEKEKEQEQEQEQEREREKANPVTSASEFYRQYIGQLTPFNDERIKDWVKKLNSELVIEALKRSINKENQWAYAEVILNKWYREDVKTLSDAETLDIQFRQKQYNQHYSMIVPEQENIKSQNFTPLSIGVEVDLPI